MMPMPTWIYTSSDVYFLFEDWETKTVGPLILGCFISFLMALLHPFLTSLKSSLVQNHSISVCDSDDESLIESKVKPSLKPKMMITLITGVQYTLASIIMLLMMTYNLWVFLAIVFGYSLGYFLFISATDYSGQDKGVH
eukprot:CAMPEP_0176461782 /NCGR_PEP_ID=MMETSP0127-20121128/34864_1 /TAXON_ID=938130 /ORGANISM="Platyophrya macrostoma, Strain WH" /LENGTH=138 /DNA_ID=CAMNT_0017853549 /DNA_START=49 /DNA_END=462 /DNA_ORIENTATION=-